MNKQINEQMNKYIFLGMNMKCHMVRKKNNQEDQKENPTYHGFLF